MKTYKLNDKANFFYDATSGIKVFPGKTVEISPEQVATSKRLRAAISSGHLISTDAVAINELKVYTLEEKLDIFKNYMANNTPPEQIAKKFNMESLKEICESIEIEVEESDTKLTLTKAIIEDLLEQESNGSNVLDE